MAMRHSLLPTNPSRPRLKHQQFCDLLWSGPRTTSTGQLDVSDVAATREACGFCESLDLTRICWHQRHMSENPLPNLTIFAIAGAAPQYPSPSAVLVFATPNTSWEAILINGRATSNLREQIADLSVRGLFRTLPEGLNRNQLTAVGRFRMACQALASDVRGGAVKPNRSVTDVATRWISAGEIAIEFSLTDGSSLSLRFDDIAANGLLEVFKEIGLGDKD